LDARTLAARESVRRRREYLRELEVKTDASQVIPATGDSVSNFRSCSDREERAREMLERADDYLIAALLRGPRASVMPERVRLLGTRTLDA
jgi:hypothetical protein